MRAPTDLLHQILGGKRPQASDLRGHCGVSGVAHSAEVDTGDDRLGTQRDVKRQDARRYGQKVAPRGSNVTPPPAGFYQM